MEGIKVVMFDLGNVIICFDHMISAKRLAAYCDKKPEEIYNLFFASPLAERFDRGEISGEQFFAEIKNILNLNNISYEDFCDIWNQIFWQREGISEVIDLICAKFEKFIIISNVNKLHFEYIYENFPIVRKADEIILSYEVGVLKPDPLIYEIAIEKSGVKPEEIFYTDDREELVTAAHCLGINAVVFRDPNQLKELLGIL